jgi:hypothetical protein
MTALRRDSSIRVENVETEPLRSEILELHVIEFWRTDSLRALLSSSHLGRYDTLGGGDSAVFVVVTLSSGVDGELSASATGFEGDVSGEGGDDDHAAMATGGGDGDDGGEERGLISGSDMMPSGSTCHLSRCGGWMEEL